MDVEGWDTKHWNAINQAVHALEVISVAIKVLPIFQLTNPWDTTVPSNVVGAGGRVSEAALPVVEAAAEFRLVKSQIYEGALSSATTAAANAARTLFTGIDTIILQGGKAKPAGLQVNVPNQPEKGLVDQAVLHEDVPETTDPLTKKKSHGDSTVIAVNNAIAQLNNRGHVAPFALLLPAKFFGEINDGLGSTVRPIERIEQLVTKGIESALVPAKQGLLLSVGAQVAELCVGIGTKTEFLQQTGSGEHIFRNYTRIALRVPNPEGLVRLDFK
jgi:hypothetical protein